MELFYTSPLWTHGFIWQQLACGRADIPMGVSTIWVCGAFLSIRRTCSPAWYSLWAG